MRKWIKLFEGADPRSNHPAFTPDATDGDNDNADGFVHPSAGWQADFEKKIDGLFGGFQQRWEAKQRAHEVYRLVMLDTSFDNAVKLIADRDGLDPALVRAQTIEDYKELRGDPDLYATEFGHKLVHDINSTIKENLEEAFLAELAVSDFGGGGDGENLHTVLVDNISWDTDGEGADDLPNSVTLGIASSEYGEEAQDEINEQLSNRYGYLVDTYNYRFI